jgi:predicted metal-dependent hydrolase
MKIKFITYPCEYFLDLGVEVLVNREHGRRTISLIIKENFILVKIPKYYSNGDINKLLREKNLWIRKKFLEKKSYFIKQERNFIKGDKFFLYGSELILDTKSSNQTKVASSGYTLKVFFSNKNNKIKSIIEGWYKNKSLEYFILRTAYLAKVMGTKYNSIKIKNFKRRLGSCSYKGDIVYNWRIIMSPKIIIDYIIIHELCHTIHFNHSKNFWNLVREFSPNYKEHKLWLKKNIEMLHW